MGQFHSYRSKCTKYVASAYRKPLFSQQLSERIVPFWRDFNPQTLVSGVPEGVREGGREGGKKQKWDWPQSLLLLDLEPQSPTASLIPLLLSLAA